MKTKRRAKPGPLGGVSLPVRRETAPTPLREWLYVAATLACILAGAAYDGEGGPVLVSLGCALIFASMFWSSRKKRLTGKPWRKLWD